MKKTSIFILIIFFSSLLFCDQYQFVCIEDNGSFQQVYKIDDHRKTISKSYSINLRTKETFSKYYPPYSNLFWNNEIVGYYQYKINEQGYDEKSSIQWFDLRNNRMKISTYHPDIDMNFDGKLDDDGFLNSQHYNCHKIY